MFTTTVDTSIPAAWSSATIQIMGQAERQQNNTQLPAIPASIFSYKPGNALTTVEQYNSITMLGWSQAEALETLLRLHTFAEDWDEPEMEAYDEL